MSATIVWGLNIGQHSVKNTISDVDGQPIEAKPFPAVIAPASSMDNLGIGDRQRVLTASVDGTRYIGGTHAQRDAMALRQMSDSRLAENSPIYQALVRMCYQHLELTKRQNGALPNVYIVTALPVGWLQAVDEDQDSEEERRTAEQAIKLQMERHIRTGLKGLVNVKAVLVRSEPAAVIYHELFNDQGQIRKEQQQLIKRVVPIGDFGGGTINHAVLDEIVPVPGQSKSPALGSRTVIEAMMIKSDMGFVDAERRLIAALQNPGTDKTADRMLKTYQDTVVDTLTTAWRSYRKSAYKYLFAGGTLKWVRPALEKAFPADRAVYLGQRTIATGLWRYGVMQAAKGK